MNNMNIQGITGNIAEMIYSIFRDVSIMLFREELPQPYILIYPKDVGKTCRGEKIWHHRYPGKNGILKVSIFLDQLEKEDILTNTVHLAIHQINLKNSITDTSDEGKRHNKYYRKVAESIDVRGELYSSYGYFFTFRSLPENMVEGGMKIIDRYYDDIRLLLKLVKSLDDAYEIKRIIGKQKDTLKLYRCLECGQEVYTQSTVNLLCGVCGVPFKGDEGI